MAKTADRQVEHLLRRAGFGARPDELELFREMTIGQAVDVLVNYDSLVDDVDALIGKPGYVGMTFTGTFAPQINITHNFLIVTFIPLITYQ